MCGLAQSISILRPAHYKLRVESGGNLRRARASARRRRVAIFVLLSGATSSGDRAQRLVAAGDGDGGTRDRRSVALTARLQATTH